MVFWRTFLQIRTIDELKAFATQPMPVYGYGAVEINAVKAAQAALPEQIEINKNIAGFLVTHFVDGVMREEEARKRYKPGLSLAQFGASSLFSFMTQAFGLHNVQSAYMAYKNLVDYSNADRAMEPTTKAVMGSYRVEERRGKFFLVHGTLEEWGSGVSFSGAVSAPSIRLENVGLGIDPSRSLLAEKLYNASYLDGGSSGPSGGRSGR